jgi:hypothetical protein
MIKTLLNALVITLCFSCSSHGQLDESKSCEELSKSTNKELKSGTREEHLRALDSAILNRPECMALISLKAQYSVSDIDIMKSYYFNGMISQEKFKKALAYWLKFYSNAFTFDNLNDEILFVTSSGEYHKIIGAKNRACIEYNRAIKLGWSNEYVDLEAICEENNKE